MWYLLKYWNNHRTCFLSWKIKLCHLESSYVLIIYLPRCFAGTLAWVKWMTLAFFRFGLHVSRSLHQMTGRRGLPVCLLFALFPSHLTPLCFSSRPRICLLCLRFYPWQCHSFGSFLSGPLLGSWCMHCGASPAAKRWAAPPLFSMPYQLFVAPDPCMKPRRRDFFPLSWKVICGWTSEAATAKAGFSLSTTISFARNFFVPLLTLPHWCSLLSLQLWVSSSSHSLPRPLLWLHFSQLYRWL